MKLTLTPRALLLAASLCLARADILVQDGFLDETAVTDVMQQLPATGASRFRDVVDLPSTLYGRLLSVLQPGAEGRNLQAPVRGEQGPVAAHKDHFADGSVAAAQVGLVYLEGDGRMTFTHDATGKETVVDVKPGRFLSWNNAEYTHVLEAGLAPRRMLGPMAFKDGLLQSIGFNNPVFPIDGAPLGPEVLAQAYVTPLVVRPGRVFTVTLDIVVLEFTPPSPDGDSRKLADSVLDELVVSVRRQEKEGRIGWGGCDGGRGGGREAELLDGWNGLVMRGGRQGKREEREDNEIDT
jgi:hypothetical protein